MRLAKWTFNIAGIWGLLILLPQYFLEEKNNRDFPPAITHPEYFYGFIGVALAFQILFLIIAGNPVRYRGAMIAAMLEKLSCGAAVIVLYVQQRVASLILGLAILDLVIGAFFVIAFLKTPDEAGKRSL